jgi:hypothetical protein
MREPEAELGTSARSLELPGFYMLVDTFEVGEKSAEAIADSNRPYVERAVVQTSANSGPL